MDQVAQEQARRKHAEERERYWRSKYDSEALVVDEEDNADLDSMFWATKKEKYSQRNGMPLGTTEKKYSDCWQEWSQVAS